MHGIPVSERETLFSTPEDLAELEALLRAHPYPQHSVYIRSGVRRRACSQLGIPGWGDRMAASIGGTPGQQARPRADRATCHTHAWLTAGIAPD